MERYVGPKYAGLGLEIAPVPEGHTSSLVWTLGSDPITRSMAKSIDCAPTPHEQEFILAATRRDPSSFSELIRIDGRRANFDSDVKTIRGVSYDTLEIGGYGYHPLQVTESTDIAKADITAPVAFPSADNFANLHPDIVQTGVIDGSESRVLRDEFSFAGAYTQDQATKKVAATLFFLQEQTKPRPPTNKFVVPVPIAIGQYPAVRNPEGDPAYFIAWRVPYGGKRHHDYLRGEPGQNESEYTHQFIESLKKIKDVAGVLRFIHDTYGITHNQPHPGNFYIPVESKGPVYLADFSTVFPLSDAAPEEARAFELSRLVARAASFATITTNLDQEQAIEQFYRECLSSYSQGRAMAGQMAPHKEWEAKVFFEEVMKRAMDAGLIKRRTPGRESMRKIEGIKQHLDRSIASAN